MSSRQAAESRYDRKFEFIAASQRLLCESFGQFDEDTAVGGILDFPKGDDEPQPFDNIQVDLIIPEQLQ
jgi:hypothetical protein